MVAVGGAAHGETRGPVPAAPGQEVGECGCFTAGGQNRLDLPQYRIGTAERLEAPQTEARPFVLEVQSADTEQRLSVLTAWIIAADRTREDYGLRIPGSEFPPSHGEAHRRKCLETLALFGLDESHG